MLGLLSRWDLSIFLRQANQRGLSDPSTPHSKRVDVALLTSRSEPGSNDCLVDGALTRYISSPVTTPPSSCGPSLYVANTVLKASERVKHSISSTPGFLQPWIAAHPLGICGERASLTYLDQSLCCYKPQWVIWVLCHADQNPNEAIAQGDPIVEELRHWIIGNSRRWTVNQSPP